jgi:hypothetical protein
LPADRTCCSVRAAYAGARIGPSARRATFKIHLD